MRIPCVILWALVFLKIWHFQKGHLNCPFLKKRKNRFLPPKLTKSTLISPPTVTSLTSLISLTVLRYHFTYLRHYPTPLSCMIKVIPDKNIMFYIIYLKIDRLHCNSKEFDTIRFSERQKLSSINFDDLWVKLLWIWAINERNLPTCILSERSIFLN